MRSISLFERGGNTGVKTSALAARGDTRTRANHTVIPNDERLIACAVDDIGSRTNVDTLSDVNIAGDMNARSEGAEVSNPRVMSDSAIKIDVDVAADLYVYGQNAVGADDRAFANSNRLAALYAHILKRFESSEIGRYLLARLRVTDGDSNRRAAVGISFRELGKRHNRQAIKRTPWRVLNVGGWLFPKSLKKPCDLSRKPTGPIYPYFHALSVAQLLLLGSIANADVIVCADQACATTTTKPKAAMVGGDLVKWCDGTPVEGTANGCLQSQQKVAPFSGMATWTWIITTKGWYRNEDIDVKDGTTVPPPPTTTPPPASDFTYVKPICTPKLDTGELRRTTENGRNIAILYCDNNPRGIQIYSRVWTPDGTLLGKVKTSLTSFWKGQVTPAEILAMDAAITNRYATPAEMWDLAVATNRIRLKAHVYSATGEIDVPLYKGNPDGTRGAQMGRVPVKDKNGNPIECDIGSRLITKTTTGEKATSYYAVATVAPHDVDYGKGGFATCKLDGPVSK